jgi:hypothetical protein
MHDIYDATHCLHIFDFSCSLGLILWYMVSSELYIYFVQITEKKEVNHD